MLTFDFADFPLWLNSGLFLVGAAVVWFAGTRLATHANAIAEITGLGSALVGMLLLGGITSLPEIAVSTTASIGGSAPLAVNNILGGVAFQVVVIAIGDAALRGQAISAAPPAGAVVVQAVFSCLLLCIVAGGILATDIGAFGVGLWPSAILFIAIGMLWGLSRRRGSDEDSQQKHPEPQAHRGLPKELAITAALAAAIVVAGFLLARSSEALAEQTGLGQNFVGAILTSISTSLPEISTVLGAVWIRKYVMAFSDIFGTNIFDIALLFLIDAVYAGPLIMNEVSTFSVFAAVLGIAVTLIYTAGLIWRPGRTFMGLGLDSIAVVSTYIAGAAVLYTLR